MAGNQPGPYPNSSFNVRIGNKTIGDFLECSSPGIEVNEVEYRSGSEPSRTVRKLTGLAKHTNVTLKRGITTDTELFDWMRKVRDGFIDRRDVIITLLDGQGHPLAGWRLHNAFPVQWIGPSFNSKSNEIAIESIELAYEGLEFQGP